MIDITDILGPIAFYVLIIGCIITLIETVEGVKKDNRAGKAILRVALILVAVYTVLELLL